MNSGIDSRDTLIDILKEKYEYENKRKQTLDDSLNLPVSLLSFLTAGAFIFLTDTNDKWMSLASVVGKWVLLIALLITTTISFVNLYVVFFGLRREYSSFPDSDQVHDSYLNLIERHYEVDDEQLKEQYLISDLKEYSIIWYKDCNRQNIIANDKRNDAFFRARMWLGISMIIGILVLLFICIYKIHYGKQTNITTTTTAAS